MKGLLFVAVVVAAFGSGLTQTRPPPDPCRTCQIIINIARHHFNNTVNDKAALQAQLLVECARLAQFEGDAAAAHCRDTVNNNIDVIYDDMHTNKSGLQTCQDINECPQATSPPMPKRQKRQQHDPCRVCEIIIGIAKRHFHNNFTDQNALKTQLDMECQNLVQHGFTQGEADHCQQVIDNNIAAIFSELANNPTASPQKICQDFNECPRPTTGAPMRRAKRQRPNDACRTCEIIINIARFHFHNQINDKNALKAQLLVECQHLAQTEGQVAAQHCATIVNNNIDQIYADMSTNKSPRQTCQDIKECPQPTGGPLMKHKKLSKH